MLILIFTMEFKNIYWYYFLFFSFVNPEFSVMMRKALATVRFLISLSLFFRSSWGLFLDLELIHMEFSMEKV